MFSRTGTVDGLWSQLGDCNRAGVRYVTSRGADIGYECLAVGRVRLFVKVDGAVMLSQERTDESYIRMALRLARDAADCGEVPVGAVAVDEAGRVVARAYNQVEMLTDGTAHAEMIALTQAAAAVGDWRLQEVTLYVTKEPCAMCAGAMVNTRLGRLVYGCPDPRCGAAGSALNLLNRPGMLHTVSVEGGVCADECLEVLQSFFQKQRNQKKEDNEWRADS